MRRALVLVLSLLGGSAFAGNTGTRVTANPAAQGASLNGTCVPNAIQFQQDFQCAAQSSKKSGYLWDGPSIVDKSNSGLIVLCKAGGVEDWVFILDPGQRCDPGVSVAEPALSNIKDGRDVGWLFGGTVLAVAGLLFLRKALDERDFA